MPFRHYVIPFFLSFIIFPKAYCANLCASLGGQKRTEVWANTISGSGWTFDECSRAIAEADLDYNKQREQTADECHEHHGVLVPSEPTHNPSPGDCLTYATPPQQLHTKTSRVHCCAQ